MFLFFYKSELTENTGEHCTFICYVWAVHTNTKQKSHYNEISYWSSLAVISAICFTEQWKQLECLLTTTVRQTGH